MDRVSQPSVTTRRLGQAPIIIGIITLLTGCGAGGQAAPEWPAQPSPSYPAPPTTGDEVASTESTAQESSTSKSVSSPSSSTLAKEYSGKEAQRTLEGKATYYADSLAGNHTASGDVYDPEKFTAAHKKLPFGSVLRVTRTDTGKSTYVKVNDRGPFGAADRILDLSRAAAEELEMLKAGVVEVKVEVLEEPAK